MSLEVDKIQLQLEQDVELADEDMETGSEAPDEVQTSNKQTTVKKSQENEYVETHELAEDTDNTKSTSASSNTTTNNVSTSASDSDEVNEDDGIEKNEFEKIMSKNKEIKKLINDFGLDESFDLFDIDGNGKITTDEIKELNSSCDKLEDFTKGEIKKILNEASGDKKSDSADKADKKDEDDEDLKELVSKLKKAMKDDDDSDDSSNNSVGSSGGSSGVSGGGGVSGGSGVSGSSGSSGNTSSTDSKNETKETTLEELEKQKAEKEKEVETANNDLKSVYSGENAEVKKAQDDYEKAEQDYKDKLESDKNISEELKKRQKDNLENIDNTQKSIDETNSKIVDKNAEITTQKTTIAADKSNVEALKAALSAFPNPADYDDKDKQAEIQSQKTALEAKIKEAEAKETQDEEKLKTLEGELDTLNTELKGHQDKLAEYEKEQTEIETEIEKSASQETKDALKAWKEAKTKVETTKTDEAKKAQTTLDTKQKELDEINTQINEKKAEETKAEYTTTGSIPADLAKKLDEKLGAGFCAKVEQVAKSINCDPNDLLGMMYSESGIDPNIQAGGPGSACGLIGFLPSTAEGLGTTADALASMSGVEQLDYVEKFYQNNKSAYLSSDAKLSAGDLYTLCFLPAFVGRESLCSAGDSSTAIYYNANSGLDVDGNGDISKTDLTKRVQNKYQELLSYYNLA